MCRLGAQSCSRGGTSAVLPAVPAAAYRPFAWLCRALPKLQREMDERVEALDRRFPRTATRRVEGSLAADSAAACALLCPSGSMGTKRWSAPRPAAHPHDENSAPPPPPWQSSSDSRSGHLGNSHANAKPRTHTRSQSWLSSLLKPSNSSKRRSKEPTPRPGRPLLADRQRSDDSVSALPQRRPSVVTRKPVPVIIRVDSEEHPPRQATLSWPVTSKFPLLPPPARTQNSKG